MNWQEKYYTENLYPFQDGVLNIVKKSGTPFYLTGGTALSRGYFNHRYSDDLDLFVNKDDNYDRYVQTLFEQFGKTSLFSIDYKNLRKYENYTQMVLVKRYGKEETVLKLDLVNDIAAHYGYIRDDHVLGNIDSWQNILSNKLAAVFRYEPKDIADIWIIAKHRKFNWIEILQEAKTKEAAAEPLVFFEILKSFPIEELNAIKWIRPVDLNLVKHELDQIAEDIMLGQQNRFGKSE